jgi:hypothetical protein
MPKCFVRFAQVNAQATEACLSQALGLSFDLLGLRVDEVKGSRVKRLGPVARVAELLKRACLLALLRTHPTHAAAHLQVQRAPA